MNMNDEIAKRKSSVEWSKQIAQKVTHKKKETSHKQRLVVSGIIMLFSVLFTYYFLIRDRNNLLINPYETDLTEFIADSSNPPLISRQVDQFIEVSFNRNTRK